MANTRRPTVLAVYAHPDDEIFHAGVLAHLSAQGARVQPLVLTHGEAGKVHDPSMQVSDMAAVRGEEMRLSCERLGIEPPLFLDFHDSARGDRVRRDDPRALANVDMLEVEAAILAVVRDVKPHVIVTHDPHGGYYHPDHLATHRAVTAAFYSSGSLGEQAPERLFYEVIERETFRAFVEASRGQGPAGGLDADVCGTPQSMIALSFDAKPYAELKLRALAAHRSQFGLTLDTIHNPPPPAAAMLRAFAPVFERESFVLGATRTAVPA